MDIESKFREKRIIRRKKQFDEIINTEILKSPQELFRIDYFLYMVDQAITALQSRFEQFKMYEFFFGFLFSVKKLKSLNNENLKENYLNLEHSLSRPGSRADGEGKSGFV